MAKGRSITIATPHEKFHMSSRKTRTIEAFRQRFSDLSDGSQDEVFRKLGDFLFDPSARVFVLKGAAGTGKTAVLSALAKGIEDLRGNVLLMAPTGRAAQVLSGAAGIPAHTIHKRIYNVREGADGNRSFELKRNPWKKGVHIVDEASMIGLSGGSDGTTGLLDDLLQHVVGGDNGCKLLLCGDDAQLPPVGTEESPALSLARIEPKVPGTVMAGTLELIYRQEERSGILENALRLRAAIERSEPRVPTLQSSEYADIERVSGEFLEESLEDAYGQFREGDVKVICRSNKRANLFNQQIRTRILWREDELEVGDRLMVVRNDYYWIRDREDGDLIANGELIRVERVHGVYEELDTRFCEATVLLLDQAGQPELEVLLNLEAIHTEKASLDRDRMRSILDGLQAEQTGKTPRARYRKAMEDARYNALQVKFAYAVTCHKSQGGQWPAIFVDPGMIREETIDHNFLRWLYTALTRATEKVFLVNFPALFFGEGE